MQPNLLKSSHRPEYGIWGYGSCHFWFFFFLIPSVRTCVRCACVDAIEIERRCYAPAGLALHCVCREFRGMLSIRLENFVFTWKRRIENQKKKKKKKNKSSNVGSL